VLPKSPLLSGTLLLRLSQAEPLEPLHRQPTRLFLFEPGKQMAKTPPHPASRAPTLDIELVKSNLHVLIHAHSPDSPWASMAAT